MIDQTQSPVIPQLGTRGAACHCWSPILGYAALDSSRARKQALRSYSTWTERYAGPTGYLAASTRRHATAPTFVEYIEALQNSVHDISKNENIATKRVRRQVAHALMAKAQFRKHRAAKLPRSVFCRRVVESPRLQRYLRAYSKPGMHQWRDWAYRKITRTRKK